MLTGWTEAELRAASPELVDRLHWRVIAGALWSPDVERALALDLRFLKGPDKTRAHKAREAARSIHDLMFPKDE